LKLSDIPKNVVTASRKASDTENNVFRSGQKELKTQAAKFLEERKSVVS
jgi:hypothetical protein